MGTNLAIQKDASVLDMSGKTIYPGFIDSWVEFPVKMKENSDHDSHWNVKVHPRLSMSQLYQIDINKIKTFQKLGFTSVHLVPDSGIFQGQTAVIQLDRKGTILQSSVAQLISYEVEGWGSNNYPNALLGVVALIRQTFLDADWDRMSSKQAENYPQLNVPLKQNHDLDILGEWINNKKPFIFETNHELTALRSLNIANEFELNCWLRGSGYEYRRINEIAAQKPLIIVPMDFPVTPDISNPYQALSYSTAELKHWAMAPDNPAILAEHNIPIALTAHGLEEKEFRKNLIRSVERGLSESAALAALTTTPAERMGLGNQIGKIKTGYLANLTVVDGNYFKE